MDKKQGDWFFIGDKSTYIGKGKNDSSDQIISGITNWEKNYPNFNTTPVINQNRTQSQPGAKWLKIMVTVSLAGTLLLLCVAFYLWKETERLSSDLRLTNSSLGKFEEELKKVDKKFGFSKELSWQTSDGQSKIRFIGIELNKVTEELEERNSKIVLLSKSKDQLEKDNKDLVEKLNASASDSSKILIKQMQGRHEKSLMEVKSSFNNLQNEFNKFKGTLENQEK